MTDNTPLLLPRRKASHAFLQGFLIGFVHQIALRTAPISHSTNAGNLVIIRDWSSRVVDAARERAIPLNGYILLVAPDKLAQVQVTLIPNPLPSLTYSQVPSTSLLPPNNVECSRACADLVSQLGLSLSLSHSGAPCVGFWHLGSQPRTPLPLRHQRRGFPGKRHPPL